MLVFKSKQSGDKNSKGEYVLLLNPDTIIAEDTLKTVCDIADTTDRFGALGVRMVDMKGAFA